MGLAIQRDRFVDTDYADFSVRLMDNLDALRNLLQDPRFGVGPTSLGAELELSLVDADASALPLNREVLADCDNENTQLELDNFNLEYNFLPSEITGRPFGDLEQQIVAAMNSLGSVAGRYDGRVVSIGILPTLTPDDLLPAAMTDLPRYRALAAGLSKLKGTHFDIDINGTESLKTTCETITLEGANTSFQVHLRIDPDCFARTFNAAQLMTPLVLASSANSPVFLQSLLWDETRIALFKQATDTRRMRDTEWRRAARVPFGHGWVRGGALELFEEAVALHPVLLPVTDTHSAAEQLARGAPVPSLRELRLHQSTIWQWNRPVYDPAAGGHLRIEFRALPAGPTPVDMAANAAFIIGLVLYYRDHIAALLPAMPFRYAEYNFYRAAQSGLDAALLWPTLKARSPRQRGVRELIDEVLPNALQGLTSAGVDAQEARRLMDVVAARNASGVTGSRWQRETVKKRECRSDRKTALKEMLEKYIANQASGDPVGSWSL